MTETSEIEVLLATFDGERFLRAQMDSILAQDYPNVRILARDDGSRDSTVEILREYVRRYPGRVRLLPSRGGAGSTKTNFLALMRESTANYICFADQDDVWLPEKLSKTKSIMDRLEARWGVNVPLLAFTDLRVVDETLGLLHESFWAHMHIEPRHMDSLHELLGKSVVTGCTAMVNRPLLELSSRMPEQAAMHDQWIALLACVLGKSAFLSEQTVLYRQHDRNVLGIGQALDRDHQDLEDKSLGARIRRFKRNRARFVAEWMICQQQAMALLTVHSNELPSEPRRVLEAYRRCETSKSRVVRIAVWIRYRFFSVGRASNLAVLFHLWNRHRNRAA